MVACICKSRLNDAGSAVAKPVLPDKKERRSDRSFALGAPLDSHIHPKLIRRASFLAHDLQQNPYKPSARRRLNTMSEVLYKGKGNVCVV
ncbi:hypothetical protein GOP47_0009302 [Adiantum capillus-veneris]|uniref:Uncharacterized protein n=1 Tax=Adiantum capillus-veneris TaxID=13818 RepID=A0A9D4UWG5_ADICA|nr:hypothetical protein GOP47_0009302 [Adiantum capillus-veneris]